MLWWFATIGRNAYNLTNIATSYFPLSSLGLIIPTSIIAITLSYSILYRKITDNRFNQLLREIVQEGLYRKFLQQAVILCSIAWWFMNFRIDKILMYVVLSFVVALVF